MQRPATRGTPDATRHGDESLLRLSSPDCLVLYEQKAVKSERLYLLAEFHVKPEVLQETKTIFASLLPTVLQEPGCEEMSAEADTRARAKIHRAEASGGRDSSAGCDIDCRGLAS